MTSYLLDTHVWSWSLLRSFLPPKIKQLLDSADSISLSAISLYEIRQKVRIGKWPEIAPYAESLIQILAKQGASVHGIGPEICSVAGSLDWSHRDPFDRIIAATSIELKIPLISADVVFDRLKERPDRPGRIW